MFCGVINKNNGKNLKKILACVLLLKLWIATRFFKSASNDDLLLGLVCIFVRL